MPTNLSFEIFTCRDYLDKLVKPAYQAHLSAPLEYKDALAAAIFTWHLHDWVFSSHESDVRRLVPSIGIGNRGYKDFKNYLITNTFFKLIFEIVNGTKHLMVTDTRINTIHSTQAEGGFFQGLLGLGTATYLTINDGRTRYFLSQEIKKCVDWWENFLANIGI